MLRGIIIIINHQGSKQNNKIGNNFWFMPLADKN